MSPSVTVRLLATQSDARLVELARHGHERAFEALVQRYRKPLLGYCRRVLLPEARAEDALQQALLQAWLALERGAEVHDARAWLYRIVHNTALNALRSSGYDYAELSEALTGAGAPEEDLARRIAVREALAGLATLPAQQREALLRTAVEGASHADAASEMGLTEGAIRGLVYRARMTLRTVMTAITPMPFATWAARAAEHGGGVGAAAGIAEVAAGGGSAGVAGLLAKGGVFAVTAGVLAAGAGTVTVLHHRDAAAPRPIPAARAAVADAHGGPLLAGAPLAAGGGSVALETGRRHGPRRHGGATLRQQAPGAPVGSRRGGGDAGAGGTPPRHDTSGGDGRGDGGGGSGSGGRHGDSRLPGSGSVTDPRSGDGGGSGSGEASGSGSSGSDGGSTSGSTDGGSSGTSGGSGSTDGDSISGGSGSTSGTDGGGG